MSKSGEWTFKPALPVPDAPPLPKDQTLEQLKQCIAYWESYIEAVRSHKSMSIPVKDQEIGYARSHLKESAQWLEKKSRADLTKQSQVPLFDVSQQGWATTDGLKVFMAVSHPDAAVQERIARELKQHVDACVQDGRRGIDVGARWHCMYTTQGLGSLLAGLTLPAVGIEDRDDNGRSRPKNNGGRKSKK